MELNTIYKRCRGHKERQRRSVQNLYTFLDKDFVHRNFNKIGKQPPIALRTDGASVASTDFFLINLKVLMLLWLFGKLTSQQVYKYTSCLLFYTPIFVLLLGFSASNLFTCLLVHSSTCSSLNICSHVTLSLSCKQRFSCPPFYPIINKKTLAGSQGFSGAYETRTRDLLRDRQAF